MLLIAALIGATWLFAAAHLAVVARPAFVAGAIAIAFFYIRRSPWQYMTAVLWIWTLSPFVRRVVDYYGGFQSVNIVLLAPQIVTLLMLRSLLTSGELWKRNEAGVGLLLLWPVLYGLAISFLKGDVFAGAVASLDWFVPLLFYFYLINFAPRIAEAEAHFRAFFSLNLLIIVVYGFYQFYSPSVWDLKWVETTNFTTSISHNHKQMKLFSMLNSPGTCAVWVGALILISMQFGNWLSVLLLPPALLYLTLTEVRTSVGAVVLGIAAAAFFGVKSVRHSLIGMLGALAIAASAMTILDPSALDRVIARYSTVHDLQNDGSALAREDLYRRSPAMIADYPFGLGIGALGKGARASVASDIADIDSGIIAPFAALGWIAGVIYLFGSLAVVMQAWLGAIRTRSPAAFIMAIVAMTGIAESLFNLTIGLHGIIIWLSAGYASAVGIRAQMRVPTENIKIGRQYVAKSVLDRHPWFRARRLTT